MQDRGEGMRVIQPPTPATGRATSGFVNGINTATEEIYEDAPETPAPLFAFRAFKHALFGTPKQNETLRRPRAQPRRISRQSTGAALGGNSTTIQPDRAMKRRSNSLDLATPRGSPRKPTGILLTPGTAGKNRKSVSFYANQRSTEHKPTYDAKTGSTPKAVPGYFPSPTRHEGKSSSRATRSERQDRRASHPATHQSSHDTEEDRGRMDDDFETPMSPSGQYWKSMHEQSELEMRKVLKREQIARKFARCKEEEVTQLHKELEQERNKVEALEAKMQQYVDRLKLSTEHSTIADAEPLQQSKRKPERPRRRVSTSGSTAPKYLKDVSVQDEPLLSTDKPFYRDRNTLVPNAGLGNPQDSDIWADLEHGSNVEKQGIRQSRSESLVSRTRASANNLAAIDSEFQGNVRRRRPLTPVSGNIRDAVAHKTDDKDRQSSEQQKTDARGSSARSLDDSIPVPNEIGGTGRRKASQMSLERREAAKKRLEDRRRARAGP